MKLIKGLLVINLLILNVVVGVLVYRQFMGFRNQDEGSIVSRQPVMQVQEIDRCGVDCLQTVRSELAKQLAISSATNSSPTLLPTPEPTKSAVITKSAKKVRTEEYMTIPGSGTSSFNDWTNLTGTEFYFDTRDFPGLTEVYFEANMKLLNGNGRAYVRLYDVTHGIGVNGSENDTTSQSDTWAVSQKIYFWQGRNLIRVQAKSLTADTAVYGQGRLRIIREE